MTLREKRDQDGGGQGGHGRLLRRRSDDDLQVDDQNDAGLDRRGDAEQHAGKVRGRGSGGKALFERMPVVAKLGDADALQGGGAHAGRQAGGQRRRRGHRTSATYWRSWRACLAPACWEWSGTAVDVQAPDQGREDKQKRLRLWPHAGKNKIDLGKEQGTNQSGGAAVHVKEK